MTNADLFIVLMNFRAPFISTAPEKSSYMYLTFYKTDIWACVDSIEAMRYYVKRYGHGKLTLNHFFKLSRKELK